MTRDLRYVETSGLAEQERSWWVLYEMKATGLRVAVKRMGTRRLPGDWRWAKGGQPLWVGEERPEGAHVWVERMPFLTKRSPEERTKFVDLVRVLWASGMGRLSIAKALGVSTRPVQWATRGTGETRAAGVKRTGSPRWDFVPSGETREQMWAQVRGRFGL